MSTSPTPADLMNNLSLDEMSVDTSIAEEYIKNHNGTFSLYGQGTDGDDGNDFFVDSYGNKIVYKPINETDLDPEPMNATITNSKKLKEVARNIEKNANLFAQLEYLIRKMSVDEIKKYDVNLIAKRFHYYASCNNENITKQCIGYIDFLSYRPLAKLGFAAELLFRNENIQIRCDVDSAVLGNLFTEICHKSGYTTREVRCWFDPKPKFEYEHYPKLIHKYFLGAEDGCVAVITDKSDIDSAVDAMVSSTHNFRYPWRLRRILVQESVYERFHKTIGRRSVVNPDIEESIKEKSAEIHFINNKIFLSDFTGDNLDKTKPFIFVEAYRTTKELMSLLKKYRPVYMSVWCTDISVSNEIAFGTNAEYIWINDFGVFDGPKDIAHSYYTDIEASLDEKFNIAGPDNPIDALAKAADNVAELREKWLKIDIEERVEIVNKVIDEFNAANGDKDIVKIKDLRTRSFVVVDKGKLCIGIAEIVGVVLLDLPLTVISNNLLDVLKSVVAGNAMIIRQEIHLKWIDHLIAMLVQAGVPIIQGKGVFTIVKHIDAMIEGSFLNVNSLYRNKVIWSQYGETFAN